MLSRARAVGDVTRALRRMATALAFLLLLWAAAAGAEPFAYIANTSSNNVSVIDTATGTVTTTVGVGSGPVGVAVNWAGTRVYVGNSDGTVSVIRTDTHAVVATVPAGGVNRGVAVNPAGTRVYVADSTFTGITGVSAKTVTVVDTAFNTAVATVTVGEGPIGLAVTPDGAWVYVANSEDGTVSVIDTSSNTVVATVTVEWQPYGVAVNPAGTRVYVANSGTNTISVIDTVTRSVIETLATGSTPMGVAMNAAGTRLYVANRFSTSVSVFDLATNTPLPAVVLDPFPYGVAVTPNGQRVYVTLGAGVAVIDTATDAVSTQAGGNSFGRFIRPADTTTHFSVVAPASAVAGSPFAFTVTALDQFNNVATGYTGTVQFTRTDAGSGSAVPANYTFLAGDNGVKVFASGATLVTPGNRTLTATDTASAAITGTSANILVSAAAATHFTVAAPASAVAGTAFSVTVTALDQFNNTATSYAGTVHFTSTDAAATLPADATLTNGVRTFSATLRTAGSRTLTVSDTVAPAVTGTSPAITVTAVKTVSGPSATGTGTITAVLTGGGPGCTFALAQFIAVSGDPGSPPAGSAPPGVEFPHGLFDFKTTGCTPGSAITLAITYPAPVAPGTAYWKYGPRPGPIAAGWYVLPSTVAAGTITFSITDGQLGDDDLLANGTIVDQGGPGTAVPVPTLSTWAMIVLALALLVVGAGTLRRRDAVRP